jgi:hypothetical protein
MKGLDFLSNLALDVFYRLAHKSVLTVIGAAIE